MIKTRFQKGEETMLRRIGKKRKWSQEKVVKEVRELYRKRIPLNFTYLLGNYFALYSAMIKYFGSYRKAIEASSLNYRQIRHQWKRKKSSKWNSEKVIKEIIKLYQKSKPIHYRFIRAHHQGLEHAARKYFGSYKKAIEAAGLDYATISQRPRWRIAEWIKSLDDKKMEELRKRIERLEGGNSND